VSLRDKIVEAALDRFHAQGFNACSVQDITDAAGAPKGSFYNHFKTKELLALAALERFVEDSGVEILLDKSRPALQRLRQHFQYKADQVAQWGFERGCMIGNFAVDMADAHPEMRVALAEVMRNWTGAIAAAIREAQARGEIAGGKDADQLARYLIGSFEGALLRARVEKSDVAFADFLALAFDALLV
jgi:TetR/AcrR family transcriptional repressor of nem operon